MVLNNCIPPTGIYSVQILRKLPQWSTSKAKESQVNVANCGCVNYGSGQCYTAHVDPFLDTCTIQSQLACRQPCFATCSRWVGIPSTHKSILSSSIVVARSASCLYIVGVSLTARSHIVIHWGGSSSCMSAASSKRASIRSSCIILLIMYNNNNNSTTTTAPASQGILPTTTAMQSRASLSRKLL